jgi:uncharacterized protein (DUF433 family)
MAITFGNVHTLAREVVMDWQAHIVSDSKIMVGKPVVKGTRLTVEHLMERLANGWTEGDLLESYPGLTHEDLQACFAYVAETLKDVRIYPIPA